MIEGLISIIVPTYNVEKYLSKCIESLIYQTYKNIEIIIIDDGSNDQSGKISDEYARIDHRIKVIHQPNRGVSVARQRGLDEAKGDYIIHVDPDDWVEKDALQTMHDHIKNNDADILFCDFYEDIKNKSKYIKQQPKNYQPETLIKQILHYDGFYPLMWNSLIRHQFILEHDIKFFPSDICIGEDTLFICKLLKKSPKVSFCHQAFYHYNKNNSSSITRHIRLSHLLSRYTMINALDEVLGFDYKQDLIPIKKNFLFCAFCNKHFDLLERYPDIHNSIIEEGRIYSIFKPISSCLSLSLRINPLLALYIYKSNICIISIYEKLKQL